MKQSATGMGNPWIRRSEVGVQIKRATESIIRNRSGFTLLEILLAVSIAVLIGGVILSVFRMVSMTPPSIHGARREFSEAISALDTVGRDLACGVCVSLPGEAPFVLDPGPIAEDRWSSLAFYCAVVPDDEKDLRKFEIHRVSYIAQAVRGESRVLIRETRAVGEGTTLGDAVDVELAQNAEGFRVLVFDGNKWHNRWPVKGGKAMPTAARIELDYKQGRVARTLESEVLIRAGRSWKP